MITAVDGKGVGAGKSYRVVNLVLEHLAQGGTVCPSDKFQLKWDACKTYVAKRWGVYLEDDQLRYWDSKDIHRLQEVTPPGTPGNPVLIIVDEAQSGLGVGQYRADKDSKDTFFQWLCESRHDDNDLIFISQNVANMDGRIRRLCTHVLRATNMATVKIPGIGKWPFKQFLYKTYDQDGKTLHDWKLVKQDPAIFACYESKAARLTHKRASLEAVERKQLQRVKRSHPMLRILIVVGVLGFAGVCYKAYGLYSGTFSSKPKPEKTASATAAKPPQQAVKMEQPSALWKTERQSFRGTDELTYLRTDKWEFRTQTMTPWGYCVELNARVAKCIGPDKVPCYIVAAEDPVKAQAPGDLITPKATPKPEVKPGFEASPQQRVLAGMAHTDEELQRLREIAGGMPAREKR